MSSTFFGDLLNSHLNAWAQREREVELAGLSRLPRETIHDFRTSGVLLAPVPDALGGYGQDLYQTTQAIRRLARKAPSTALCLAMPLGNAANTQIPECAVSDEVRPHLERGRRWIAERLRQGLILAVANSEPGASGDLTATKTRASTDEKGQIRLSGRKSFATLGLDADYFLCSARRDDGQLDAFFASRTAEGVTLLEDWAPLGMRATASVGLVLNNAPAESVFVYPGAITGASARHWSTLLIAAVFVGVGEGALDAAVESAPQGSAWARSSLAECALRLDAASAFVEALAMENSIPTRPGYEARCRRAKTFAARTGLETATKAIMVTGGRAYRPEHPVARLLMHAAAGPMLRPPLAPAMDAVALELFNDRP
jgi:alkylation response protein AidB-like acyl-CoA dehydrogenase